MEEKLTLGEKLCLGVIGFLAVLMVPFGLVAEIGTLVFFATNFKQLIP